eukprot:g16136.t1
MNLPVIQKKCKVFLTQQVWLKTQFQNMGEPNQLAERVGNINLNPATAAAPAGFWKSWAVVEKKAPADMKHPCFVRVSAEFAEKENEMKIISSLGCR